MNKILKKLSLFHYNIGFFDYNPEKLSQGECSVAWLRHPYKDRFFADPFILSVDDDEIKVLVEDFEYRRWKGCISLLVVDRKDYHLKRKKTLLDLDTHLSFPFILRKPEGIYVIPENSESGRLTAWKYDLNTETLSKISVLTDMAVIDPVVRKIGEHYYLYGSIKGKNENGALYQWESMEELSGYRLMREEPVKQGKEDAWRGGNFFMMDGQLYAATQCCTHSYGEALTICKVNVMDNTLLEETPVVSLYPQKPYTEGLHTLNISEGLCVVDGLTYLFRPVEKIKRMLCFRGINI